MPGVTQVVLAMPDELAEQLAEELGYRKGQTAQSNADWLADYVGRMLANHVEQIRANRRKMHNLRHNRLN